jgi:hypothetical protein
MSMRLAAMAMGLCMAMSVLTAQAAVYKWKDANGRVHYGDQPTAGAEKVSGGAVNDADADAAESAVDQSKQKRAEDCARKREQLANYKRASKIIETDSLGAQKEFSDDERKKLLERTQKQVADSCGEASDDAAAK